MRLGFYSKTALNNLKNNYRIFIPRILSEAGLIGCFYIVVTLALDERLCENCGGDYIPTFMLIGGVVIGILSIILMFYINSFLMKQRKKEFGMYNILGMEKKHIGKVLFFESLICTVSSIIIGMLFGLLFYKLSSLLICKLLQTKIVAGFYFVTLKTLVPAPVFFTVLDLIVYFVNRITIRRMKPVELLSSKHIGEKEPKVKWVMLILGILSLAGGYAISLTIKSPLKAVLLFFVAVILVIFGTYFLFVTGTTFILKLLKNNDKFYYNKKHMPSVSGLLYRMKQNAVGLASICILATGVLVMISTTVSLYSGMQETLDDNYKQHLYLSASYGVEDSKFESVPTEILTDIVDKAAEKQSLTVKSTVNQNYLSVSYLLRNNQLLTKDQVVGGWKIDEISMFTFITEDTYSFLTDKTLNLKDNEYAICRISSEVDKMSEIPSELFIDSNKFIMKSELPLFPISNMFNNQTASYGIVVSDKNILDEIYRNQKMHYGDFASEYTNRIAVEFDDVDKACKVGNEMNKDIENDLNKYVYNDLKQNSKTTLLIYDLDTKWDAKINVLSMYGTFLFLGILLGLVCLFSTLLIIYYKQISEGYEDRERFQIMEKVGMSNQEVKKTIKSQLLLQFFLPLIVSGVHVAFAFPILTKMLHIFLLSSTSLFIICTLITFAVFALVYIIIFRLTARTYYKIVH